jgi:calcineurin-like phosphoesterase family protein
MKTTERRGEVWFTADSHFGHTSIIRFCDRPFADVTEMNETLISNWNECVRPGDTIYHLGDFAHRCGDPLRVFRRLNGNKHLILGNHDKPNVMAKLPFGWIKSTYKLTVDKKIRIWLSHYAHRRWPHSHHGSIHLFGHSHGGLPDYGKSTDVGVDAWDYKPVHLDTILKMMEGREETAHHE